MNLEPLANGNRKLVLRQSDFKTYMTCGREFYLGVVRNLEPAQRKAGTADTGTFVHAGLQAHYKYGTGTEAAIAAAVNEATDADPLLGPDLAASGSLAQIMVAGYLEWLENEAGDHGMTAIAVEERIELSIGTYYGIEVCVSSGIDLLFRDENDDVWIYDHKTVDAFKGGIGDILDIDFQGQVYDMAARSLGYEPVGFVHNRLRRVKRTGTAKPPFYDRQTVRFNAAQRERHLWHMQGLAEEIAGKVWAETNIPEPERPKRVHQLFRPLPTKDCSWRCDFLKTGRVCPMLDHEPEGAEEMLQSVLFKQKESL